MSDYDFIMINELPIRLGFFFGTFAVMALWEILSPRRRLQTSKAVCWANNLGLILLNSLVLRLAFPAAAVGVALHTNEQGWGLFNVIEAPIWMAVLLSVVALDFFIWLQHVMVHAIPVLWRLHRVHHADLDFDVTTGARFHPLEILLSLLIKSAVILLLGPPVVAVLLFEVLLNATAMFNHGNVRIPETLDRGLRLFVVTPDMHRVHHSVEDDETNSNFGFNLPRLIGNLRRGPTLDIQDFKQRLDTETDLLVLDVRTVEDYVGEQGHIENAVNIPLEDLQQRMDELGDYLEKPVTIVCRTDKRSAKAALLLTEEGFADVHVVRGGMTKWNEAGWPVTR